MLHRNSSSSLSLLSIEPSIRILYRYDTLKPNFTHRHHHYHRVEENHEVTVQYSHFFLSLSLSLFVCACVELFFAPVCC